MILVEKLVFENFQLFDFHIANFITFGKSLNKRNMAAMHASRTSTDLTRRLIDLWARVGFHFTQIWKQNGKLWAGHQLARFL